jgi:V8-like Glu-specific endopeptidase
MTAGHCIYIHNHGGWPKYVDVMAGRDASSKPYGTVRATSFCSVKGWVNDHDWNYDYGCIKLPTDLGKRTGWFGFACYSASTLKNMLVNNSGYPGDKPTGTQWFNANRIVTVTGRKLYYYIDTMGGQSGSPIWRLKNGHRYAVGIHAYGGSKNSATRISKPVFNNMRAWKK